MSIIWIAIMFGLLVHAKRLEKVSMKERYGMRRLSTRVNIERQNISGLEEKSMFTQFTEKFNKMNFFRSSSKDDDVISSVNFSLGGGKYNFCKFQRINIIYLHTTEME